MSRIEDLSDEINAEDLNKVEGFSRANGVSVLVIFFDDMVGSTLLKEKITSIQNEEAFQKLRREHDNLLTRIISRDGAGAVFKSTGDGLLAVFKAPSTAVERAIEIQEALSYHQHLSIRIGMDMGQVHVESAAGTKWDLFGRHVDWAARAESLADGGHIIVTRTVYIDAYGAIPKAQVQWKKHGFYIPKKGENPIEVFEPYNANNTRPMEKLNGKRVSNQARAQFLSVVLFIAILFWLAPNIPTQPKSPGVTMPPPHSRLSGDQIRAELSTAMHSGKVERALGILATIGDTGLKQEECERVYSFSIKNRKLREARAVVEQCWTASRKDEALAGIEREELKSR